MLLDHGKADLQALTSFGSSPLHLAVKHRHMELMQLLVTTYHANVIAQESDGQGPLVHAETVEMVDFLLNEGAY